MFPRTITVRRALAVFLFSLASLAQQNPSVPQNPGGSDAHAVPEFPVLMKQSVAAGKTQVGTKIQAKLEAATLFEGKVIPKNAVLSGEVVESTAKTSSSPSKLAIRIDSAQWKSETLALKIYLTAWYYPATTEMAQSLQYGPGQAPGKGWNGMGQYPNPNAPGYKPFPGGESDDQKTSVPETAASKTTDRRVLMKNIQSERAANGEIAIVSERTTIKLDKITTYVFASGDLMPPKK